VLTRQHLSNLTELMRAKVRPASRRSARNDQLIEERGWLWRSAIGRSTKAHGLRKMTR